MEQYHKVKKQHQDCLLFFRLGDFYEMFYEDAKTAARVLGIALTSRFKGTDHVVPMAGVPFHSVTSYLNRLLRAGFKVAVCEQLEDADEADDLVERGVIRIVTPGTLTEGEILNAKTNNFLAAVTVSGQDAGLAWVDLSTGEFRAEDLPARELLDELTRISPSETLFPESLPDRDAKLIETCRSAIRGMFTPAADWTFDRDGAVKTLSKHFSTANLDGFGCGDLGPALAAAGAVIEYLNQTQKVRLSHIVRLETFVKKDKLILDRTTQLSLELTQTLRGGDERGTLLWVLDRTCTPMGARLMREWITCPLTNVSEIKNRQAGVGEFAGNLTLRNAVQQQLSKVYDIERITSKLGSARANGKDLVSLKLSLSALPGLKDYVSRADSQILQDHAASLDTLDDVKSLIHAALVDDPPVPIKEGGLIREGFDAQLDETRAIAHGGKKWIAELQQRERERTGIQTLKIGYTNIFGYYIEITHANTEKVPSDYTRKQTLKNAERYVTPELKEYEEKVLTAEERSKKMEYEIFLKVRDEVAKKIPQLLKVAHAVAVIDVLASLGLAAFENSYCPPVVDEETVLSIKDGRHPVLEKMLEEKFVSNDVLLDCGEQRLLLITGPNMAGKSTYIRQVALMVLMAQMGGFVPAKEARIGVVDRIFTRVGAADELARGRSTFMVEMNETANILNNATARSLIVLDEIGRGTSTFDGVSIAWAVTEYIHDRIGARTMFATHYHELTEIARLLPGVRNFHISIKEWGEKIIFIRKIVEGATDKSYGIHVARLAGIPKEVIERAKTVLTNLEAQVLDAKGVPKFAPPPMRAKKPTREMFQLSMFGPPLPSRVEEELKEIDTDKLTPLEALQRLQELKKMTSDGGSPENKA
jgi:DNA mismatch repair protein MutS